MTGPPDAQLVLHERVGHVELLTLNRPEKRNALSEPLREALVAALDAVRASAPNGSR